MPIPDWSHYNRECRECGEKYHESEGGHECPPDDEHEEYYEYFSDVREDESLTRHTRAERESARRMAWEGTKSPTCHPDDIPF